MIKTVRHYHQITKHTTEAYAPSPGFLDWDSQPDPFRRFVGAERIKLPLVSGEDLADYDQLYQSGAAPSQPFDVNGLGLFLELALGLSAWKEAGPDRWALRNNPSSGNLHPTEGYVLVWQRCEGVTPGLYHYNALDHVLERRARLEEGLAEELSTAHPKTYGAVMLSTITWREEWKYGARALRYCQLDVGHALGALSFAGGVLGWGVSVDGAPGDDLLAALMGLKDFGEAEPELADVCAFIGDRPEGAFPWEDVAQALSDWAGQASVASQERVAWPQITQVIPSLHKPDTAALPSYGAQEHVEIPPSDAGNATDLIRQRRSAQRMDAKTGMTRADFERTLARTLPQGEGGPLAVLPYAPAINLLIFVHDVEGYEPGLYLLVRNVDTFDNFRRACDAPDFKWDKVADTALPLWALDVPGDYRKTASQLSCYQGIAGRGAFSLGMLGALGAAMDTEGAWAWRRLHWEAGLIGQVLYLEAEASGVRGTGIGCFFDDDVHRLIGLDTGEDAPWQTLYHFTVGGPIEDQRLKTAPPYAHLNDRQT
ncbi:SagB/ThcOx family dehydrogenase [Magnetovibrio sp. PR-2]|uniref:SagB/ThcOx family dehydrogenase n=1 Tax=Magnetovibrio sp. PR-2 TaxID=3120356 RepID=UPI002FCE1CB8